MRSFFGLVALLLLSGTANADTRTVLHMGDQRGGYQALLNASGELTDLPYDVDWHEFPAAAPLVEAINAGAIDGGPVGDAPLVFAVAAGAPLKAIAANRSDPYGTAVLTLKDSPYDGIQSLKGKRIATGKGSIGNFVVLAALDRAGLAPSDVQLVFLSPVDAKTALLTGSVDAWATWEPYTAVEEVTDPIKVTVSGTGLWSGLSYFVGAETAIRDKRAALADLARRLARAQDWANAHVDAYSAVVAKLVGIPDAASKRSFERRHTVWVAIDDGVIESQQRVVDLYAKSHIIPERYEAAKGFDRSFSGS